MSFLESTLLQGSAAAPTVTISSVPTVPGDTLIVAVAAHQGTVSDCQFNSSSITQVATIATAFNETAQLWIKQITTTATANVVVTFATADLCMVAAMVFKGLNYTGQALTSATGTGSTALATVSLTPTVNSMLIDCVSIDTSQALTPNSTKIWVFAVAASENASSQTAMGEANQPKAMSTTIASGQRWAEVAMAVPTFPGMKINSLRPRIFSPGIAR